jgi:uncharacterized protein YcfJ
MFKKLSLAGAVFAMSAAAIVPATPSVAQRGYYGDRYERSYERRGYDNRRYDDRRGYDDRRYYRNNRGRGCSNGDGGTVIGAIAGGLLGNTVAGRGDKLLGTVIGGAGGALAGRAIDKSGNRGYCR